METEEIKSIFRQVVREELAAIVSELIEIRGILNVIYAPVRSERQRQLDSLPAEERKRIHREELRQLREAEKRLTTKK